MSVRLANYMFLYEAAVSLIPQGAKVVEWGCGTGEFASLAIPKCRAYYGYDIDPVVIEEAKQKVRSGTIFLNADITNEQHTWIDTEGFTYVALEVLEHLPAMVDLDLIKRLPRGIRFILSVPSFDSEDHEKFFPREWEAIHYYHEALDIDFWRKIRIPTGAGYFHLMRGWR